MKSFRLVNQHQNEVELLAFGASIQSLILHDRQGKPLDVVLGYDNVAAYEADNRNYFGATVGRIAGRLSGGGFAYNQRRFDLEKNHGPYHLHGGSSAMSHQVWTGNYGDKEKRNRVVFSRQSPAGENGYPGTVATTVIYEWTDENCLRLTIEATTTETTPLAMTNHAYFNLNGAGNADIQNHYLQIFADHKVGVLPDLGHTGKLTSVQDSADDFRHPVTVGSRLAAMHKSHGAMYVTDPQKGLKKNALFWSENSGLQLEVWSNQAFIQFYTGEHLSAVNGKSGKVYNAFAGACFECQGYPDSPNFPEMGNIFLHPGQSYSNQIEYRFSWLT